MLCDCLVSENIAPSGGVVKSSGTYNHKKKEFQYRTCDVPVNNLKVIFCVLQVMTSEGQLIFHNVTER